MATAKEQSDIPRLVTAREPVGPASIKEPHTTGETAFMDAVVIIGVAWAILFVLWFSLRRHNV